MAMDRIRGMTEDTQDWKHYTGKIVGSKITARSWNLRLGGWDGS